MGRELDIRKTNQRVQLDTLNVPVKQPSQPVKKDTLSEQPKLFNEEGWHNMDLRVQPGENDSLTISADTTAMQNQQVIEPVNVEPLTITASVGVNGVNKPEDVEQVAAKLQELGIYEPGASLEAAIIKFQSYIMSKPDGRIDPGGMTITKLQIMDAAAFEELKKEKQQKEEQRKKVEEQARLNEQKKAAADKTREKENAQRKAEAIRKASELIEEHTNWGGLNLDEEGLGAELAGLALTQPAVILAVMHQLTWEDRDDVASVIVDRLGKKLVYVDKAVLERLYAELEAGVTTEMEEFQMKLIKMVLGVEEQKKEGAESIRQVAGGEIWQTQMKNTTEVSIQCFDACKKMLSKFNESNNLNLEIGGRTDILKLATENTESGFYDVHKNALTATKYIDTQLLKGYPVIVGVSHTVFSLEKAYNEGTTDHFVVIVAKGRGTYKSEKETIDTEYYQFLDPGTFIEERGTSPENRLFYDPKTNLWRGNRKERTGNEYVLTQVRPFKVDHPKFTKEFQEAVTEYSEWQKTRGKANK